jgi:hypothetical protein
MILAPSTIEGRPPFTIACVRSTSGCGIGKLKLLNYKRYRLFVSRRNLGRPGYFYFGFGPGLWSPTKYFWTALAVVTQFLPIFIPHISPLLTKRRRWLGESPLTSAASCSEISSVRSGLFELLSFGLSGIWSGFYQENLLGWHHGITRMYPDFSPD